MFNTFLKYQKGQSLIELLITIALASLLLPVLLTSMFASRQGRAQQTQRLEAISLLKESLEALRSVREKDWVQVETNGVYHPLISSNSWSLVPSEETINGYTRKITITDALRDSSGKIVELGGAPDLSTKKAVISVSWSTPLQSSVESTVYLTRFLKNDTHIETTVADFNAGTKTGVTVTNTSGGEVVLAAGGRGEWCKPALTIAGVDLPKNGVANAVSAIEGQVFAGTGDNASGVSFANVAIANPPYPTPPSGSIAGTFDGYKTNDVFGETNYAYLATDNHSKEVVIIDLTRKDSNNKYSEIGYFDVPGQTTASRIYVFKNKGYVVADNKFYVFDLSEKTGSRPQLGQTFTLLANGTGIAISEDSNGKQYAYISLDSWLTQMQIIDTSNPQNLYNTGFAIVNGQGGKNIFVNSTGTRAYLVTVSSSLFNEFFIINTEGKTGYRPIIGSYNANGMDPKDLAVVTNNKAIIVGTGGEEYQVVDISNESHPSRCGGLNIDVGVNGISTVIERDGDAYAYIITGDTGSELKIIEGGPGGNYSSEGTFESKTFDSGKNVAFNNFSINAIKPVDTNIKFQVGVKKGDCSSAVFTFVGPDGTSNSYFATGSGILTSPGPAFENPGRCLRYKAFLTTLDASQTPVLYDITFNYSL